MGSAHPTAIGLRISPALPTTLAYTASGIFDLDVAVAELVIDGQLSNGAVWALDSVTGKVGFNCNAPRVIAIATFNELAGRGAEDGGPFWRRGSQVPIQIY